MRARSRTGEVALRAGQQRPRDVGRACAPARGRGAASASTDSGGTARVTSRRHRSGAAAAARAPAMAPQSWPMSTASGPPPSAPVQGVDVRGQRVGVRAAVGRHLGRRVPAHRGRRRRGSRRRRGAGSRWRHVAEVSGKPCRHSASGASGDPAAVNGEVEAVGPHGAAAHRRPSSTSRPTGRPGTDRPGPAW